MAKRRAEPDSVKLVPAPVKKTVSRAGTAAKKARVSKSVPAKAARPAQRAGSKGLLHAGLTALGNVRDDVVRRQTNVIGSLLGLGTSTGEGKGAALRAFPVLDALGVRKFEDVFDERVAAALQRLGVPSAQEIQELRDQVRLLQEHLARAELDRRKR
jgi:Poly(hydroxyalcanoate) granule associated protein (phasin)